MGQEVHRKGLILRSSLDGNRVDAEIIGGAFSMAMLEMHLQMNYDDATVIKRSLDRDEISVTIEFGNQEDAIRFHLSH